MSRLVLVLANILLAAPAFAAEGASATWLGVPRWVWAAINLVIFFGFIYYLLAKPMGVFFRTRREEIARQLDEAARQRDEQARLRSEMEGRLASLDAEIAALRERLQREGERDREALVRQGEEESKRLLAQVEAESARRVEEARTGLAREAATIAAELARELLEKELSPADRERIFRTTLERLRAAEIGGGA